MVQNENPTDGNQNPAGDNAPKPTEGVPDQNLPKPEDKPADKADPAEQAPAEYSAFTVAEGKQADAGITAEVVATAKKLGLTQAKAQELYNERVTATESANKARTAVIEGWKAAAAADAEIGGAKAEATTIDVAKAVSSYGTPALQAIFKDTNLDQHPEIRRFLAKVGQSLREDKVINGNPKPAPKGKSAAETLYGGTAQK